MTNDKNWYSHRALKNELWALIKIVGEFYVEHDDERLKEYAKDVYELWKDDLEKAVICFRDLRDWVKECRRLGVRNYLDAQTRYGTRKTKT